MKMTSEWSFKCMELALRSKRKKKKFLKEGKWLFLGKEVGSLECDLCSRLGKTIQGCGATLGPSHLNTTSPQKHRGEGGAY